MLTGVGASLEAAGGTDLDGSGRSDTSVVACDINAVDMAAVALAAASSVLPADEPVLSHEEERAYLEADRLGAVDERPRLPIADYINGY